MQIFWMRKNKKPDGRNTSLSGLRLRTPARCAALKVSAFAHSLRSYHARLRPQQRPRQAVFMHLSIFFFSLIIFVPTLAHASGEDGTPKVANWYFKTIDTDKEAEELARYDLLILDITNESTNRNRIKLIRKLNPDIVILAYISFADIRPDAAELQEGLPRWYIGQALKENPEWILRDKNYTPVHLWEDYYIFNITDSAPKNAKGQRFNEYFTAFLRDAIIKDPLWDGVFGDNLWEDVSFVNSNIDANSDGKRDSATTLDTQWNKGMRKMLKQIRRDAKKYRKHFIVSGNGGVGYSKDVNGVGFEHFPTTKYGKWVDSMDKYNFIMSNALPQQLAVINTNVKNTGNKSNYRKFRFGLMSALLNDGYYSFDNGDKSHTETWYYDEYDAILGSPISGSYNMLRTDDPTTKRRGVWRRDYSKAIVLINSTKKKQTIDLRTGYEKINGQQDPKVNSGDIIGRISIPKRDGIILLRRQNDVEGATYLNGGYTRMFNVDGKQIRKSFFSYDGRFPGGAQVHKIVQQGRTVVADDTWVRVYDNRNHQIAAFAPYGTSFTGGVNIAVGTLYGGKKSYIVTGRKSGTPLVRIYDTRGNIKHPGCFPFDKNFRGGVNVSVGDLNGDKRQEIVVSPGVGGGPQVRILNNYCEVISPGFLAFPENMRSGVSLAVGDVNGDRKAEIIAAPGPGGGSQVRIFNRNGTLLSPGFFAYGTNDRSGVFLSTGDVNQDGKDEIIANSFSFFNLSF